MKGIIKTLAVVLLLIFAVTSFVACNNSAPENLAGEKVVFAADVDIHGVLGASKNVDAYYSFGADLLTSLYDSDNAMISPLSIYLALSMVYNAAEGDTRAGMADALGLEETELNLFCGYLYSYFMENDKNTATKIANSIWINKSSSVQPKQSFLDVNSTYYGADAFRTEFNNGAVKDMNKWVEDNTDGKIKKMIDQLSADACMVLLNTVLFEGIWNNNKNGGLYEFDRVFTHADGSEETRTFINPFGEMSRYYYSDNAKAVRAGFKERYYFLGILPNGTLDEYMNIFDGSELKQLLTNYETGYDVYSSVPTFEYDYSANLNDYFKSNGMVLAFDPAKADLTRGFTVPNGYNPYISDISHKTNIALTKHGVTAAASTKVEVYPGSAAPVERPKMYLHLDRPFLFCIIDAQFNLPIFIGTFNG